MRVRRLMLLLGLAVGMVLLGAAAPAWASDVDGDGVDDAIDVCSNTPPGTVVDGEGRPLGDLDLDCDADLEDYALFHQQGFTGLDDYALFQQGFTGPLVPPVVIDTVPVGNPGNADDTEGEGYGGLDYVYNIGKFEVTAGQYTQFLNAVADEDTYGLYNPFMDVDDYPDYNGCNIKRTGSPGSYVYGVAADWATRPVNFVSWGCVARFANWLHKGQPAGSQDLTTTEDGSYYLNGATSDAELMAVVREEDATWVIPSEDEWYKAAYHYNDGVTGNYYDYPTSSDSVPSNDLIDPDLGNNATFWDNDYTIGSPYWLTEAGAHENSESPYDTFDQGGNVWEWNEAIINASFRGLRGGSYGSNSALGLHAAYRPSVFDAMTEHSSLGFRVAEVP